MSGDSDIGRVLGTRYRIDALIGRGGMSTVYRGFDLRLDRSVAIKLFQSGNGDGARWDSEVRLLSQLSHPHLVTLHDAHLEPAGSIEPSYLIMELVPGRDLQQQIAKVGPSPALASLVVEQIGEALGSVHRAGIVHRDLKPGNILIEASELPPLFLRAKLADFGIAHLLGADRVTQTGTMVGTAAYTAPEQVQGEAATPASDVYALGLVAIESLTGERAFGGSAAESLVGRLSRDPHVPDGLPPAWIALLASMTSRDPSLRPSALDAAIAARRLSDVPVADGSTAPTSSGDPVNPELATEVMLPPTLLLPTDAPVGTGALSPVTKVPSRHRGRRVLIGVVIVAAVLGLVGLTGFMLQDGPESTAPPTTPSPTISDVRTTPTTPPLPSPSAPPVNGNGNGNGRGNGHGNGNGNGNGHGKNG